jgi:PAT family beta-lactamase induction signal transducer AmpG
MSGPTRSHIRENTPLHLWLNAGNHLGNQRCMRSKNLLETTRGRFLTFGLLYISEGIPFGFTSTAMVAFMRTQGLSLTQIGVFVAALFLPWSFKWIWAPLIDLVKVRRFGGRKAWIFFCTSMMIVTLLVTAMVDFVANYQMLLVMIVLNNFFCATQDVAIDSLAVSTLKEEERGRGNGFMFGGQYLGIALGGGGAIFVFGFWGFNVALMYVSALLFLCLLFVVFFVRDPDIDKPVAPREDDALHKFSKTLITFVKEVYVSFLKSGTGPKVGLLFSILPIGAMALGYALLSTIQVDYGLVETQIAELSIYNTIVAGMGCLIGGVLGDRFGIKNILGFSYVLTALPTVVLAMQIGSVGLEAVSIQLLYGVIILHGFVFGMAFGLHAAVFMGMTNPAIAATQFTAFMAMSNLATSIANFWQGIVAERFDYAMALYIDALIVLVPLAVIPFLRNREQEPALITA